MTQRTPIHRRILSVALLLGLQALVLNVTAPPTQPDSAGAANAQAGFAHLPLAFEPNQGQAGDGVDFLVHHGQAVTAFSGTSATTSVGGKEVAMSLVGGTDARFAGQSELPSKTNYFVGNDQSQWHSDIPNFQKLLAKNVYPGIDLSYYGTNSTLEHDFIVAPGANYRQIAFTVGEHPTLDADGNLILGSGESALTLKKPVSYQGGDSAKQTVASRFELDGDIVRVTLGNDYNPAERLVIDPALVYSTYLGGSTSDEQSNTIAVDQNGNAYVAGFTNSTNFPTSSPYQASTNGGNEVFVTKFNATGSSLIYSTYLGGSSHDGVKALAVDASGNAYLFGNTTSSNFPTSSPFQAANGGGANDAFLTKLNAAGSALLYSTYLGGNGQDGAGGIAVDSSGSAYVIGYTLSTNFPTASPYQASKMNTFDAYITKFNPSGTSLVYSTYLGTNGSDNGYGIAVDTSGNAYLLGDTSSSSFPTSSPFQASYAGGASDLFVAKLNASGSALTYSSYLGGSGVEWSGGIAVDASGAAYIAGYTTSTDFPTASPIQASHAGATYDSFVTKINAAGSAMVYSTYLGGTGDDDARAIALDASNNAFVVGETSSTNFPIASAYQATNGGGFRDAFVTKLNSAGSAFSYSTYLGGSGIDYGSDIAMDLSGDAFVTGYTDSTNYPTASAFQASNAGGFDVFVTQLTERTITVSGTAPALLTFALGANSCDFGSLSAGQTKSCTHTLSASTNAANGYVISYIPTTTLTSGANTITGMGSQTASVLGTEQFGLNLKANTASGSHTASAFGANPSGGNGVAVSAYNTADQFKFVTTGETIAQAASTSATTLYTVSYIANITPITEPGLYSNLITYTIVASY